MRKKVEFYKVDYSFMPLLEIDEGSTQRLEEELINTIASHIKNKARNIKESSSPNDPSILIETLDLNDNYIFGVIGKLEDMKDGNLMRFRDKEDIEIISSIDGDMDYYVEHYTYFYIRLLDFKCALLSNSSAPSFRMHFTNYLRSITESLNLESLNIVNVYDTEIESKIDRTVELSELKMIFDSSSVIGGGLMDLENSFHLSQSNLREAKIELTLKMQCLSDESKSLLKNGEVLKSDFKKLEMRGLDEEDEEINAELIQRLLTKRISIKIDEDCLRSHGNYEKIKKALRDSL